MTFKAQKEVPHQIIPKHLVANLPRLNSPSETVVQDSCKTSADHLLEVDRLKEEMAKMQRDREQRLRDLQSKKQRVAPVPPPVLDFRKQR